MKLIISLIALLFYATASSVFANGISDNNYESRIKSLDRQGTVRIKSDAPSVTIVQTDSQDNGKVILSGSGRNQYDFSVSESGGNLTIEVKKKKKWTINPLTDFQAALHVSLPNEWKNGSLDVAVVSGALHINSPLELQSADLSTVSGALRFDDLDISRKGYLKSVSGAISGQSISADDLEIDTVSGGITVQNIDVNNDGYLRAESVSGRIELAKSNAYNANIESVSGSIQFVIPKDFNGKLVTKTVSGSVSAKLSNAGIESTDKRSTTYVIGNGNIFIEISTTSGSISFRD